MKRLLKYIGIILVIRVVIGGLLLLFPPYMWPIGDLDVDPLSIAIRIAIIGWLLVKIRSGQSGDVGKALLTALVVIVFVGDWYWNAQTHCDTSNINSGDNVSSIAVDFIPIIGDIKGLGEFSDGCDAITGEKLGSFRWFGLFGLIGLAEVGVAGDVAKLGANGIEAGLKSVDNLASVGLRHSDDLLDGIVRSGRELGEVVAKNADEIAAGSGRALNNLGGGSSEARALRLLTPKECSFAGDTLVWAEDGLQPIAEIETGDLVLAFHEELDVTGYYTVTTTYVGTDEQLVLLRVDSKRIVTTSEHPFYVLPGEWKAAIDLHPYDTLMGVDGYGVVERVLRLPVVSQMYNLEVAEAHTYFVGTDGWLVHNACFVSTAGLVYQLDSKEGNRLAHVLEHLVPIPHKKIHTVFNVRSESELIDILDEAWVKSSNHIIEKLGNGDIRVIPMNRVIGTKGETKIRMVIKDGNEIITAYPVQ